MSTPTLSDWQGQIDGLLIGDGTPYQIVELAGPDGHPPVLSDDEPYPTSDGEFSGDDTMSARTITLQLEVMADMGVTYRDALTALRWACRPKRVVDAWFRLPTWDTPRRARVKVRRFDIPTDREYEMGLATADLQLRAPDPVLYGPDTTDVLVTGFAQPAGGLRFPLYTNGAGVVSGVLDYGPPSATGRLTVSNPGTADVAPVFAITGPVPPQGFDLVRTDTQQRIRFADPIATGATVTIDSADGTATISGGGDRGGRLTYRDWWLSAPGESYEVAFVSLGAHSTAQLRISSPPGWW
ncbi:phage tail family protein [Cellulomonas timonensis]|uniref:phage tail domain-containing protein n=1 Tax=Cellulomonas timonensis TaxID=1689271 RepID=UPI000AFD7335|nr:phage tail domain-containing protein [Cellulomonas timonensis]